MMLPLASRLSRLGTETAFAVSSMAAEAKARGQRVFPFHLGDINIPPPPAMVEGISAAIADGKNGYCPGPGIPLLREQIARLISEERGISYAAENVAAQPGGKPVIAKFIAATMNPGESVLYPVPGFPIYESQIRYQGGVPVPYRYRPDGEGGFVLDVEGLEKAITSDARAIVFNNYHNPTGAAASDEELDRVAELANRHNLWLLVDDAYFAIRFDGEPARSILTRPGVMERSIVLFTCSKQFAMTGWRVGAAVGPVEAINAIAKMNTNFESCTTHFAQQAIGAALADNAANNVYILDELKRRRDLLTERLNAIDGVRVKPPTSAFYVYVDFSEIMRRKEMNGINDLMRASLDNTGVSFCTGAHFGEEESSCSHARFAFSGISTPDIADGLAALKDYFESPA